MSKKKTVKHSIRFQLAVTFSLIGIAMIGLIWLANSLLLGKYYTYNKQKALKSIYLELSKSFKNGELESEESDISLRYLAGRHNVSLLIISSESDVPIKIYSNEPAEELTLELKSILEKRSLGFAKELIDQTDDYVLIKKSEPGSKSEYIEMIGFLSDTCFFLMRTPVESIRESTKIANRFLIYVGLICILGGMLAVYFISKRFSDPIRELTDISRKMAEMDFNARYSGNDGSEIGVLGRNMNKLSESLEESISKLKTANMELQQDNERRIMIDEMRKEFISNVSHEFKTPIALIQGYAEGLKDGIENEEDRDYYCDVIIDESSKMNDMVRKFLDLNRLEFGNQKLDMERFDIVSFARNIVNSFSILSTGNDVNVTIADAEEIYVWSDEYLAREVFENYLSNAFNHCKSDGEKRIDVSFDIDTDKVKVSVFNTGDPIPNESIEHLWEKFYKVDSARSREYGGSGIGLSIVKAAMDTLKQDYGVYNKENGVVFWFTLEKAESGAEVN